MRLNKLIWYDDYTSGIEVIDNQHKIIFNAFNDFYHAFNSDEMNKIVIDKLIETIDSYTTIHFDTEEEYMIMHNFFGYEEHKKRHDFFKNIYKEIKENKFFRHSRNHLFALNLATVTSEWWGIHITTYDRELTNFIKTNKSKGIRE